MAGCDFWLCVSARYTGPRFLLAERYAQHCMFIFVTMTYSTGMPLLYAITMVSFVLTYAISGARVKSLPLHSSRSLLAACVHFWQVLAGQVLAPDAVQVATTLHGRIQQSRPPADAPGHCVAPWNGHLDARVSSLSPRKHAWQWYAPADTVCAPLWCHSRCRNTKVFAPDSVLVDATQATETITGDVGDVSGVNVALASLAADGAACLLCVCVCVCVFVSGNPRTHTHHAFALGCRYIRQRAPP